MPCAQHSGTSRRDDGGWSMWIWRSFSTGSTTTCSWGNWHTGLGIGVCSGSSAATWKPGSWSREWWWSGTRGRRKAARSPLLANVLLDEVDQALERRGHAFVRYADDCNVYVQSERAGRRVMDALRGLYAKLRLRINEDKSAVARVWGRQFLGFSFWTAPGKVINRRVAPKALQAMKERVRQLTARNGGRSIGRVVAELRRYLVGR